jgi:hypothetical protein
MCKWCAVLWCVLSLRYSAGAQANILWSAGVKDKSEVGQVISRLEAAGMPTLDISGMDAARVRAGWGGVGGWGAKQPSGSAVELAVLHLSRPACSGCQRQVLDFGSVGFATC